ncbi:MAG: MFS transporter [Sphaerobacter sp.]|nr:MFS transporter [Sphaerobacter sp.]
MASVRWGRGVYYGWVLVLALSFTEMISWGILYYGFSVFITPLRRELGWGTEQITGAFSLALLISGVAALPVGRWLDRHGPRALMTVGSVAAALLVLAWSRVESLTAFYLIWAGIGLAMAAVLYEPAFAVIATWFVRRRGRALTVLTFVAGLASVIFLPLAGWLVEQYGWRSALVVLAVILAVGTIPPHALLLRRRPADLGLAPDGVPPSAAASQAAGPAEPSMTPREALRDPALWWIIAAFFLTMAANTAVTVHLISYLIGRGYSPGFAATAAGAIGLLALPGRLVFTPLGDRWDRRYVTASIFLLQTVSIVVLLQARGTLGVVLFVLLFGAGFGAITPARAALIADYYGSTHYGTINSIVAVFFTVARSVAPVGAGFLYTRAGDYTPVFWAVVGLSALATLAILPARRRPVGAPAAASSDPLRVAGDR